MMPIVPRKSSTGMPLSTWTFLKTCSARRGLSWWRGLRGDSPPISPATAMPVAASIVGPDRNLMLFPPARSPLSRSTRLFSEGRLNPKDCTGGSSVVTWARIYARQART